MRWRAHARRDGDQIGSRPQPESPAFPRLRPDRELRQVARSPDDGERSRRASDAEPEQRLERRLRVDASIVAEHELVEVDLELLAADAVERAQQPLLHVAPVSYTHLRAH